MSIALCTLFEGDYHYGVAALANSLARTGAQGQLFAGYRGSLPTWLDAHHPATRSNRTHVAVTADLELVFVPLTTTQHLANFKAGFLLQVANELSPASDAVAYFDPDITVMLQWDLFTGWATAGISCCADIKPWMPPLHPIRIQWRKMLTDLDIPVRQEYFFYFNNGYIGFPRSALSGLHLLKRINEEVSRRIGRADILYLPEGRSHPFFIPDQDSFNIMLMATEHPVAWIGPDGMNFDMRAGGFVFNHAVNQVKPWRRRYLRDSLRGRCVTPADSSFWRNMDGPLKPYAENKLRHSKGIVRFAEFWQRLRGVPPHQ